MKAQGAEALVVLKVPIPLVDRKKIAELAAAQRLPSIFPGGTEDAAGLVVYGTSVADTWPHIPFMADRIFRGTKPSEMPVEVMADVTSFTNMTTARDIGVAIPPGLQRERTVWLSECGMSVCER